MSCKSYIICIWLCLITGTIAAQNNSLIITPTVTTSESRTTQRNFPILKTEIIPLKDSLLVHILPISISSLQPVIFSQNKENTIPRYLMIYTQAVLTGKYVDQIQLYPLLGISEQIPY